MSNRISRCEKRDLLVGRNIQDRDIFFLWGEGKGGWEREMYIFYINTFLGGWVFAFARCVCVLEGGEGILFVYTVCMYLYVWGKVISVISCARAREREDRKPFRRRVFFFPILNPPSGSHESHPYQLRAPFSPPSPPPLNPLLREDHDSGNNEGVWKEIQSSIQSQETEGSCRRQSIKIRRKGQTDR